jgi:CHAT domain-containing protein
VVITPQGKIFHKSVKSLNREALLQLAKDFRGQLTFPSNKTGYQPDSRKLYELLIAPIEPILAEAKIDTLLFSADSGLRSLPFAALSDGHQFLVEKYSLSTIPSVTLMDTRYQSLRNGKILAMGASKFVEQKSLPSVVLELPIVSESFGENRFFINDQFTVSNLLAQRQRQPTQIIHLATHGFFNPGTPKDSYIQFWNDKKLPLDQIRSLGLKNPPVELLVLSACRTAVGNEEVELGFAGLAVQAGVKSALASLWFVNDQGTLGLMSEFYQELRTAPIKAEALRQTQIAMIKGQVSIKDGYLHTSKGDIALPPELELSDHLDLSHPYYWAAFTMIGSPW